MFLTNHQIISIAHIALASVLLYLNNYVLWAIAAIAMAVHLFDKSMSTWVRVFHVLFVVPLLILGSYRMYREMLFILCIAMAGYHAYYVLQ